MKRIIFCSDTSCSILEELEYEKLGEINGGAWVAIENSKLLSIVKKCIPITLLFFSELEMIQALEGLNTQQARDVIEKRCELAIEKKWESKYIGQIQKKVMKGINIIGVGLHYFNEDEKRILKEYSYQLMSAWTNFGLDDYDYDENEEFSDEDYDSVMEEIDELIEVKSALVYEAEDGIKQLQYTTNIAIRMHLEEIFNHNINSSKKLAKIIKLNFDPKYDLDTRIYTNLERGVYVNYRNIDLEKDLSQRGFPVIPWKEGFLATMLNTNIIELQEQGKKIQIVFLDSTFLNSGLAHNQFELAVNKQIKQLKSNPDHIWFNYLYGKQMNIIWYFAITSHIINQREGKIAEEFYLLLKNEIDHLVISLSKFPVWLGDIKIDSKKSTIKALIGIEKEIISDTEYFSTLALCEDENEINDIFVKLRTVRIEKIRTLENLLY